MKSARRGSGNGGARRRRARGAASRGEAPAASSRRSAWKWRTPKSALAPLLIFGHA